MDLARRRLKLPHLVLLQGQPSPHAESPLWRFLKQIDLFCVAIVVFFALLAITHKSKPRILVTTSAIQVPAELAIGTTPPLADPMDDDNPHGRYVDALARAEQADENGILALRTGVHSDWVQGVPVEPLPFRPPRFFPELPHAALASGVPLEEDVPPAPPVAQLRSEGP